MNINEKVKIFISSNIDEKFKIIREALRVLLEETGMCSVYSFEEAGGSSKNLIASYMDKLDRMDLVVFLIDNKDGVNEGTLKEYKRCRELKRKCIFLFCNQDEKEQTEIQKELMGNMDREKCQDVPKLSQMAEDAYNSIINDILDIYLTYCHNTDLTHVGKHISETEINTDILSSTLVLKKSVYKNLKYTKTYLSNLIFYKQDFPKNVEVFDNLCCDLFQVIIGNKDIININFDSIKKLVLEEHSGKMKEVVSFRMEAMRFYWYGELEKSLEELVKALEIAQSAADVPKWLENDIALDLRNAQIMLDKSNNVSFQNLPQGQKILNNSEEPVFYPVIDRFSANFYENIALDMLNDKVSSPYVVRFGEVDRRLNEVIDIYAGALMYGSIANTVFIKSKLNILFQELAMRNREHKIFIFAVKNLLLLADRKKFENFLYAYGEYTDSINDIDICELEKAVDTIPVLYMRTSAKLMLLSEFGYYFTDAHFAEYFNNIKSDMDEWIVSQYAGDLIISGYIKCFEKLQYRIDSVEYLDFVYTIFDNDYKRWYDDFFKMLKEVRLLDLSKIQIEKYVKWLVRCMEDDEIRKNCNSLPEAVQNLRLRYDGCELLDPVVKKQYSIFYSSIYSLNVFKHNEMEIVDFLNVQIKNICEDNKVQGINGLYMGNAENYFGTIRNIIKRTDKKFQAKEIKKITKIVLETLNMKTQTVYAKVNAIKLLITLVGIYGSLKSVTNAVEEIIKNQTRCISGKDIIIMNGYSESSLIYAYSFLLLISGKISDIELMEVLSDFINQDTATQLTILGLLRDMLEDVEQGKTKLFNIQNIVFFLVQCSNGQDRNIRFYSYVSLITVMKIDKTYSELVLRRLSKAMNEETYNNKVAILDRIKGRDEKIVEYIVSKGKADNHYWVRKIAEQS